MSLFDIFKPRKKDTVISETSTVSEKNTTTETGKAALVEKLIKSVQSKTSKKCFYLQENLEDTSDLFSSKIGGIPYWDKALPFPTDKEKNPLALVLQINFADFPQDKNQTDIENLLPNQGILQFFISPDDDYYGMDSENYSNQEKFRVVYHENINLEITEKEIQDFILENFDRELPRTFGPVQEEAKLSIKSGESFLSLDDEKFQEIFQDSVKEIFGEETEDDYRTFLDDKDFDNGKKYGSQFFRAFSNSKSYILGNPAFTQGDPRCDSENLENFDALLVKLDSSDCLMWGDSGICNLFINKEKLKSRDFSEILYYWDCC